MPLPLWKPARSNVFLFLLALVVLVAFFGLDLLRNPWDSFRVITANLHWSG